MVVSEGGVLEIGLTLDTLCRFFRHIKPSRPGCRRRPRADMRCFGVVRRVVAEVPNDAQLGPSILRMF